MPCAFCRSDVPLTREHLWPEWVGRIVIIDEHVSHRHRFATVGEDVTVREYSRKAWKVTVGAVCAECNNGWMSRLEGEAKRFAEGMLRGRGRELHRTGQATLAMWATVKVLMGEYLVPPVNRAVPQNHYACVYDARETFELPALPFEVHTAAYTGTVRPAFYDRTSMWLDTTDTTTGQPHRFAAYIATFTVGRLALRVFGHTVPEPVHVGHRGPRAGSVHRLWPSHGSFVWPPGRPLDEAGLDWFASGPTTGRD